MLSKHTLTDTISPKQCHKELTEILVPNKSVLQFVLQQFDKELNKSFLTGPATNNNLPKCEIRAVDSLVEIECKKFHAGEYHILSIEKYGILAAQVAITDENLSNVSPFTITKAFVPYSDSCSIKGLMLGDSQLTATIFANTATEATKILFQNIVSSEKKNFILTSCIRLVIQNSRAQFFQYKEYCHNESLDPLSAVDLIFLINMYFEKHSIMASIDKAVSAITAQILEGVFKAQRSTQRCLAALHVEDTIDVAYCQQNSKELGFAGDIIDLDVSNFTGNHVNPNTFCLTYGLPYTICDFEIINKSANSLTSKTFETMTSAKAIPELCRCLILRMFQTHAPTSVWQSDTLSYLDCLKIFNNSSDIAITNEIICKIWHWKLSTEYLQLIASLICSVFERSAALAAVCIANIAKRTGRLQPALGGVTVALSGSLASNKAYQQLLRHHLNELFTKNTEYLIVFYTVEEGAASGAALLKSLVDVV